MTEQEQRIAIAEACGLDVKICPIHHAQACCGRHIPDYLHDLNAMHEAEEQLDTENQSLVHKYCGFTWMAMENSRESYFGTIHATAKQRAEAFLRTIGKWRD